MQPINEFLLWNSCKNHCKFCHQKANRKKYPGKFPDDEGKLKSLQLVEKFIREGGTAPRSHILFMGGELFDSQMSPATRGAFKHLAQLVASRMLSGDTGLLYLNSNLIYQDTSLLHTILHVFNDKGLGSRVRFTTSYDLAYRYKDRHDRILAERNMREVSRCYPSMPRVANCIITDKACGFLMRYPILLNSFKELCGFELNLIPYIRLHDYMAPTRAEMLSLLLKMDETYPGYIDRYVSNLAVTQERVLWEFDGEKLVYASSKDAPCGHNENFRRVYRGDDRCFICDCLKLRDAVL